MMRKSLLAALAAAMVLLAGCTGGISGSPSAGDGSISGSTGTVSFYISDQPNAIEDFEHLNVTITKVGFQQAGDGGDAVDDGNETDDDETADGEVSTAAPSTMTTTPVNATETEAPGADDDGNDVDEDDGAESGGWVEYDVDNRTVDLTELRGANASLIDEFDVPNGTYNKVFVHVGEVNATLTNGESVRVKLPSEKLQLNKRFTVENGTDVEFVFDIAVHKAGKSGKYILKPVISESGTDVPIEKVGRGSDEGEPDESESGLDAMFVGNVTQGENATIEVTREGEPVANATVIVNDGPIGVTDTSGRITFTVPDGEELEVTIRTGDSEAELEREFESEGNAPEETPTPAAGA